MNRNKKASKYRGSKTHGGGSMKKRRGAGHRGGRGRAGSGKKGDSKKPMFWKEKPKKGFVSRKNKIKTINISQLSQLASKTNSTELKLNDFGFSKLLGTGNTNLKLKITVDQASAGAIEKIKKAGGSVTVTQVKKEKPQKTEEQKEQTLTNEASEATPAQAGSEEKKEVATESQEKTETKEKEETKEEVKEKQAAPEKKESKESE